MLIQRPARVLTGREVFPETANNSVSLHVRIVWRTDKIKDRIPKRTGITTNSGLSTERQARTKVIHLACGQRSLRRFFFVFLAMEGD